MSLYGHTVCFMNCHLPAHMENTEQRLDDFEKILEMQFEGEDIPGPLDHEWVVHSVSVVFIYYMVNSCIEEVWVWSFYPSFLF